MSFDDIAKRLGMRKSEAVKIYERAMRKLKMPSKDNQKFWEYVHINEHRDN